MKWKLTVMSYRAYVEMFAWFNTVNSDKCTYADILINYRCRVLQWVFYVFNYILSNLLSYVLMQRLLCEDLRIYITDNFVQYSYSK